MTAYRLHFERVNLEAIEAVRRGRIGEPQVFQSSFSFQVRAGDTRVRRKTGGGTLYDIGVYCINAARYLFQAEPIEVLARSIHGVDRRSGEVDAITSAVLTFPKHRVATFTTSFCSAPTARFAVLGSKGELRLDSAYEYEGDKSLTVRAGGREQTRTFPQKDQFGAEIVYFSDCVLKNRTPEPSGEEGMADVAIVEALYRSAATGRAVALKPFVKRVRPNLGQAISLPAVPHGKLVAVEPPSMD
jgi:glucose-fructose oxidoreductase